MTIPGIILGMGSANEMGHYYVMPSVIGCTHMQNDPCIRFKIINYVQCFIDNNKLIRPAKWWVFELFNSFFNFK